MMDKLNEDYKPHPKLVKALDVLFIIHAEHEMNCSTGKKNNEIIIFKSSIKI